MKIPAYILSIMLICASLSSCKAKGGTTNPLDTNSFDSVAVGQPLVLDTTLGTVPDSNAYKAPYTSYDDSASDLNVDTGAIQQAVDSSAVPLPR